MTGDEMALPVEKTVRKRYDGLEGVVGLQLDAMTGTSSIQFEELLTSDGGKTVPALADNEYIVLSILDTQYTLKEIVYLITYDGASPTGTVTRGEEGTDPWTHTAGAKLVSAPTAYDFQALEDHLLDPDPHPQYTVQGDIDAAIAAHEAKPDPHPQYAMKGNIDIQPDEDLDVYGDLIIHEGARLIVHGDLIVEGTGRFLLNGKQLIISDTEPPSPANNTVWIRTFGDTP